MIVMEKPFSKVTTIAVTVILFLQLVGMDLIGCSSALPIQLFTPSGYQSYYVLGNSSMIIREAVDVAVAFDPDDAQPYSVFSIVAYQNQSRIYVDQRGNGYSFNSSDFTGADAVFELDKGGVLILDNWASPYYEITPADRGTLVSGSLGPVDGGDYFFIAGGPVNVFRGATDRQSEAGPDGNYVAGMWELFPVELGGSSAQRSYVVPVGEDTPGTGDFNGSDSRRGGTYLVVQATEDGTLVNYTLQGSPMNRTLSRGESFVISHVWQDDVLSSNQGVQVGLIGSGGKQYDIRYFTLKDANFTGYDYWIPTFPSSFPTMDVRFHVYAVTDAVITIETMWGVAAGWSGKVMSAGSVDTSFTTNGTTPVHIYAGEGERILILISMSTNTGDRDWGYVPVDRTCYALEYFIPYAPSGKKASWDMQLYVTPVFDGTTIFADYDQDGVADGNVTLDRLEAHGFYDLSDMDNTGTHLYADFPFTVVYGESVYAEIGGNTAGYDWGYTLIPLECAYFNTALNATKMANPTVSPINGSVAFTASVSSGNYTIQGVDVWDVLPPGFGYVNGSTVITHSNGTLSNPDPQLDGGVITWWLNETMEPSTTIVIVFNTTASSFPGVNLLNVVVANGTDPWGNVLMPEASAFVTVSSAGVVSGYIENVTALPVLPVPGVTVWLYNGTDDSVVDTTATDGNGFYRFTEVAPGSYYVMYDSSDPDLGSLAPYTDDDPVEPLADPLITSRTFVLPPNGVYVHDFEVALTVDLVLDKTGPSSAEVGDVVTYNYTVTNQGDTGAAGVVVDDDVCGNASYVSGDTSLDGLLDPGETWLFVCNHTVSVSDPNPLVNVAVVNTTSKDSDPGNNEDTWSVDLFTVDLLVSKDLAEPGDGIAEIGENVVFTVNITNMGSSSFLTVPLNDTYDPSKLDFVSASPGPDGVNETRGILLWGDLTGGGVLLPWSSLLVNITFTAIDGTTPGSTENLASVVNAMGYGEGVYANGSDAAWVVILHPELRVSKELIDPPGEVADINGAVTFNVTVTNAGGIPLTTVPLNDTYDPSKLDYESATPAPDSVDEGIGLLQWYDLTGVGSLAPGASISVIIDFRALEPTGSEGTLNRAEVINATTAYEGVYLSGEDTAKVWITAPVGGEIFPPDLTYARAIATLILTAASASIVLLYKLYGGPISALASVGSRMRRKRQRS